MLEVYYDEGCPLCRREVAMLRAMDRGRKIHFIDLESLDPNEGPGREALMAEIHARTADGQWITGVEVFRKMYEAVGIPMGLTRIGPIAKALDAIYAVFARNRLRLTGRCTDACRVA
jgi:predicted DCC family thiol-disulfide oxidoreductase YuxK